MEFGKSLREAREAKGYTIAQVSEMTHVLSSVIEGLEKEDFSRIAAPIYGRGFVKLYCQAIGLEAKPFVDEFMEIINGNRDVAIRERPVAPVEEPAPIAESAPVAEPAPIAEPAPAVTPAPTPITAPVEERDLFSTDPVPPITPSVEPKPAPAPFPVPEPEPKPELSRYASPFRSEERTPVALPVLPWRLILLGVAGLALLAILVCGIRALYCATSPQPAADESAETAKPDPVATPPAAKPSAKPAAKPAARSQQQSIPALYID